MVLKKFILVALAIHLLGGYEVLEQGIRLPALIGHFREHRAVENPGISFLSFLKMHYANQSHEAADQQHDHLPLKHGHDHDCLCHTGIAVQATHPDWSFAPYLLKASPLFSGFLLEVPQHFMEGIFQPPRA